MSQPASTGCSAKVGIGNKREAARLINEVHFAIARTCQKVNNYAMKLSAK